jgi:uncharacterized membrane protein
VISIKEFLKPKDKEQEKRNLRKIYLFGFLFVFLIGFIGGLYIFGSLLLAFILGVIVSLPFLTVGILTYTISIIGINKNWSKKSWLVFSTLMLLTGLAILLWNSTR